jgi:hypothetical protein
VPSYLRDLQGQWFVHETGTAAWYSEQAGFGWTSETPIHDSGILLESISDCLPGGFVLISGGNISNAQPVDAPSPLKHLEQLYHTASHKNWDGESGEPMQAATYANARAFLQSLPTELSEPDISVYPAGEVAFEWLLSPSYVATVTLSSHGVIHYAGLFGNSKTYGTESFTNGVPEAVVNTVSRVYAEGDKGRSTKGTVRR